MREINIPEDLDVEIQGKTVKVKGNGKELTRKMKTVEVDLEKKGGKVFVKPKKENRKQRSIAGTVESHIKNMITGIEKGFQYKLKTHYSHFPMNISVQGNELVIKNFAGESYPRKIDIPEGVNVEVKDEEIILTGADKEEVSQTAANIQQGTKIKSKDPRVFQDGIYITKKEVKE